MKRRTLNVTIYIHAELALHEAKTAVFSNEPRARSKRSETYNFTRSYGKSYLKLRKNYQC